VRALGGRLGVAVEVATVTVARHGSREDAARQVRYAALERHADRIRADRIAVGHTADDQAETVMMRVLEGTGLRGLAGIPVTRGRIIRPLIDLGRRELVAYLHAAGLGWLEDPTNDDRTLLRNRIRHEVLPQLEAGHPNVRGALVGIAGEARAAIMAIDAMAEATLARLATPTDDGLVLPCSELRALPPAVAVEVLRLAMARPGRRPPLRAWAHRGLRRLLTPPPPRRAFRLGGVVLAVSGDRVRIGGRDEKRIEARLLAVPGVTRLSEIGLAIEAREAGAADYRVSRDPASVAFDADALAMPLRVRGRRRGDQFRPFPGPGQRRLKTFLIDAKVPRWDRDRLPLVEAGDEIVWVAGVRRGAQAPVTASTRRVVELTVKSLAP